MSRPTTLAERRLAWDNAATRLGQALRAMAEEEVKAGFDPDQPRVPAGRGRDGGRWSGVGEALSSAGGALSHAARAGAFGEPVRRVEKRSRVRLRTRSGRA